MAKMNHEHRNRMDKVKGKSSYATNGKHKDREGKTMKSKYSSWCISCKKEVNVGDMVYYYFDLKKVRHIKCKKINVLEEMVKKYL